MTQVDLMRILHQMARDHKKRLFTLREIATLSGVSHPAAGMMLLRAEKKGIVSRISNLWMNRLDPPDLSEIAFALASPSYISFESALYYHQIISQSPRGYLSVATRARPRMLKTPLGTIRFIHIKSPLFFGYDSDRMASPEKAWLDLLYMRGRKSREKVITEEVYRDRLNRAKLKILGKKFPAWVLELSRNSL